MNSYHVGLLHKYQQAGVLVDTNILLLYFIGTFDKSLISRFKRTRQFTQEDYNTLLNILRRFNKIVTTPNILTEVSNLSGQLAEDLKINYFAKFAASIELLLNEEYISSAQAMNNYHRLGLTDAGIALIAQNRYLVLTDDFPLTQYLYKTGVDVVNFNNIRILNW
jgi:rRNA-processing protein FCF1